MAIPYNRTSTYERACESSTYKMATEADKLNKALINFKEHVMSESKRLYELFEKENGGKVGKGKGGATFFNFDRSIKVVVNVHEPITFDDNLIELAKDILYELINEGLEGAKDFVKPIVMDAFQTQNGKLDTKRVLGLRRHASKVNKPKYFEAMDLIDKAIRRPSSKKYFQIWVKDENEKYQDINLNFLTYDHRINYYRYLYNSLRANV